MYSQHEFKSWRGEDPTDTFLLIIPLHCMKFKLTNKVHPYLVFRAKNKLTSLLHLGQFVFPVLSFTKGRPGEPVEA